MCMCVIFQLFTALSISTQGYRGSPGLPGHKGDKGPPVKSHKLLLRCKSSFMTWLCILTGRVLLVLMEERVS